MDYTQQVTEALDKLGATSAEIAQTLENKGIRGTHRAESCPLSVYLTEQFPESTWGVGLTCAHRWEGDSPVEVFAMPVQAAEFVSRFDGNAYPNLVRS